MSGITTPYNLQMPSAGLIGRGSGAGRSTIMDAAAVRAFTNAVNKAGDTMTGALVVENSIKSCRDVGFLIGTFAGPGTSVLTFFETANIWLYDGVGSCRLATNGTQTRLNSDTVFGFSSGSPDGAAIDTPIVRAAAGITEFRNSTTAQQIRVSKTYTSDTNCEYLSLGFSGTNFDVVSKVGSAGGTNQPIRLGHLNAASTFFGFDVATTGKTSFMNSAAIANGSVATDYNVRIGTSSTNALLIGGINGTPNYGIYLQTNNASYPLILQVATGRVLVGTRTDDGATLLQVAGAVKTTGAITASSTLTLQNSTTAVWAELSKTYTSSTNREYLYAGFSGTNYDLCSRVGSAGGTNQPIRLGHLAADGTTFSGLTVTTGGALQIPAGSKSAVSIQTGTGGAGYGLYFSNSGTSPGFGMAIGSISYLYTGDSNSGLVVHSGWGFCFGSSGADSTPDAKLSRKSSGLIAARGNSGFSVRNYADSSDAALTCADITASGNLLLQNSTTAVLAEFSKTYTSSTNREYLNVGFTGTNYDLCSRVGSAGGSNQPIRVGHIAADGTTFTGLTVATSGNVTIGPAAGGTSNVKIVGTYSSGNTINLNNAQSEWANAAAANPLKLLTSMSGVRIANNNFVDLIPISGGLRLVVPSSYTVGQNSSAISGTDAALTCGAITASGTITHVPSSSVTLSTNGQCAIEFTSNTTGNIVYRGSDGTTRRFAFTVS